MDRISKKERSRIMSHIRGRDTKPELILRKALWSVGLRYRKYYGKEKIDIAFPSRRIAVFVDGCFWHGCPIHGNLPKSNQTFWTPKLERNRSRDRTKNTQLTEKGWTVIRVWEHELDDIDAVVKRIRSHIND